MNRAKEETNRIIQYLQNGQQLEGAPPLADLIAIREFWEGKRSTLPSTLTRKCCLGLEYRLDHLLINVLQRPNVSLGKARINIQSANVYLKASISLRGSTPGLCCPCFWCLGCLPKVCCWHTPSPQVRPSSALIASAYLQPRQVSTNGNPEIGFFPHFTHLYLNWLQIANWASIVNKYVLKDKPLAKIPLSELAIDISLIKRRVTVSSVRFIDEPGSLPIRVTIDVGRCPRCPE